MEMRFGRSATWVAAQKVLAWELKLPEELISVKDASERYLSDCLMETFRAGKEEDTLKRVLPFTGVDRIYEPR